MSKTDTLDPKDDLPSNQSNPDEREVLNCPVCGSVFLELSPLKVHVYSTDDEDHRFKRLDDDLEVIDSTPESPRTAEW